MGCTELSILGGRSSIQGLSCQNPSRALCKNPSRAHRVKIHSVDCRGCSNCTSATTTLLCLSLFLHNFHRKEKVKVDPFKGILEQGDPTRAKIKLSPEATATQCWLILPKKCNALDYQQGHLFSGGGGGGGCIIDWIFHSAAEPFLLPIALREWLPEQFL